MKARTIKRLRKIISKKGYYEKRLKRISDLLTFNLKKLITRTFMLKK